MKKILLSTFVIAISIIASAQDTITCSTVVEDTVLYVYSKTSAAAGIGIHQHSNSATDGYEAFAQMFEAPDTVTINGACFYAVMDLDPTDTLVLNMYDVNGSGAPGTSIASVQVQVPSLISGYTGAMDSSAIYLCGTFPSPIQYEGDYFLSLENYNDQADIFIARNTDGDGASEALTWAYYTSDAGTWDGWYDIFAFGGGWNFDIDIRPLVEYSVTSEVVLDTILCYGDTLSVLSTTWVDDSLMYNKFYNPNFATYSADAVIDSIDFGSGNTIDTFSVYATAGSFPLDVNHFVNMGWTVSQSFACQADVNVYGSSLNLGVDSTVCVGDSIVLDAGVGFDSYLWSTGDVDSAIVVQTLGMVDGTYTYFVDASDNGCESSDTVLITVGQLSVNLGNDTTLCWNTGESLVLDAGIFDSYLWNTGQLTQTIQAGPMSGDATEDYILEVTQGGCVGTDTITIVFTTCIGVEENVNTVTVYPNPAKEQLTIQFNQALSGTLNVKLFDLSGKQVVNAVMSTQMMLLNVGSLESGLYILQIALENQVITKQVQIIK